MVAIRDLRAMSHRLTSWPPPQATSRPLRLNARENIECDGLVTVAVRTRRATSHT
jgi:hypothetical protein